MDSPNMIEPAFAGALCTSNPRNSIGGILVGCNSQTTTAATWPSTTMARFVPFIVRRRVTITKMAVQVATQSGNYDLGIYDTAGNRLVSLGSTAVPVAGLATADIADLDLDRGRYYKALACSSATAVFRGFNPAIGVARMAGVYQVAAAPPLAATVTYAVVATSGFIPMISLLRGPRTTV